MSKIHKYPYKIEPATEFSERWKHMEAVKVLTDTKTLRAPKYFATIAEEMYNFKVRPDDVWVITYPKSGTTLVKEMVWLIVHDDYETAKNVSLVKRFPWLETYAHITREEVDQARKSIQDKDDLKLFEDVTYPHWITLANTSDRRFIQTHLPFPLLPPDLLTSGGKIIYVARNPKDAALSLFKYRGLGATKDVFPELWNLFQNDCLFYGPYWEHVKDGWNQRHNDNVCFLFYEDIVKDMKGAIRKVAAFMNKDMTEEQVEKLADHLDIKNFRNNTSVNRHIRYYMRRTDGDGAVPIRKGEVGGWKAYFTDELNEKANKWIEENYRQTDLRFPVAIQ